MFSQESPRGNDLRTSTAKVLFGVSSRQAGGTKCQIRRAFGENESAGANQEDPAAGAGKPATGGEATGGKEMVLKSVSSGLSN